MTAAAPDTNRTLLVKNIKLLACFNDASSEIKDAAIYVRGPEIQWVGRTSELPEELQKADRYLDLSTSVVIPGERRRLHSHRRLPNLHTIVRARLGHRSQGHGLKARRAPKPYRNLHSLLAVCTWIWASAVLPLFSNEALTVLSLSPYPM